MSRHLTSNPLANSGELDQLRRQLGMHVKAPESTRSAMAAMHANAQKKDAEKANRDKAVEKGLIEPEPMSQYTDEDIDVMLAQGRRADELDAQIDAEYSEREAILAKNIMQMTPEERLLVAIFGTVDADFAPKED